MEHDFLGFSVACHSMVPKYVQLADFIIEAAGRGKLSPGQPLPSLHELSVRLNLSRGTVEKAYNKLKEAGVIASYRGKGYFLENGYRSMLLSKLGK